MKHFRNLVVVAILAISSGCATNSSSAPLDEKLGGETTRSDATRNAFGLPLANLSRDDRKKFEQGDSFFTQNWVVAPASTVARDGLGPVFNAQACASCHVADGRGAPASGPDDSATRGVLVRLAVPGTDERGAPLSEPTYGDQLQDRGIDGVPAEGRASVTYQEIEGVYGDGTRFTLRAPELKLVDLAFGPLHPQTQTSARLAPQMIGLGLLEAIPERDIVDRADPNDRDNDGISGRPNYVWSTISSSKELGRFGWKANTATIELQTAGAFLGDMGLTSEIRPDENCTPPQKRCYESPTGGAPEVDRQRLEAVVFYSRSLAVPAMRNTHDPQVKEGAKQFEAMGCSSCHTPTAKTGKASQPALEDQVIHPFTDLLVHDMGPGLADSRHDFDANGQEWRTPPLWGLGLAQEVNGFRFFLHDGRARTFEEAILWHGGEGEAAKERFRLADARQREALIKYLEAL